MKKLLLIFLSAFVITACDDKPKDPNEPTQDEKNTIELALINNLPRSSDSAIQCRTKKIAERYYTGCSVVAVGKQSNTYLFLYNKNKDPVKRFYALNGSAMSKYDTYLKAESMLGNYKDSFGLPLEKDIDLQAVLNEFNK